MTITRLALGCCLVCTLAAPVALAQDRKAEQAIKHRRAALVLMSTYFSRLFQTVEGDRPFDPVMVAKDARLVEELSRLPREGFAPGTEHGDTKAKEEIWLDEEHFKRLAVELQARTSDPSKVAASGNFARLKVAFEQTRDVCNACQKEFRKK